MNSLAVSLQQLLDATVAAPVTDTTARLLAAMEPVAAEQLRLCAIPHQFDATLLQVLVPSLSEAEANRRCQEFARLSIVTPLGAAWVIHDHSRNAILQEWMLPDHRDEFAAANARLADYFAHRVDSTSGMEREQAERLSMYHRLGSNPVDGFSQFEKLCRRARYQMRLTESAALIRLVQDYGPLLSAAQKLWLAYYEAKLAIDRRDWKDAERLLCAILEAETVPRSLHTRGLLRLGQLYTEQHNWFRAISALEKAYRLTEQPSDGDDLRSRVAYEIAAAYLGSGELRRAEMFFKSAIRLARECHSWQGLAIAYNGLGNLHLKRRNPDAAVQAFHAALQALREGNDTFRAAQVYNNLGNAYAERGDWDVSAEQFALSLNIRRTAGDTIGEALALTNLARAHANQGKLEDAVSESIQAIAVFDDMRDSQAGAVARHNLGKYYRRLGRNDEARRVLYEASELFTKLGRSRDVQTVRIDLEQLDKKVGLPWWAWAGIGFFGLFLVFIISIILLLLLKV